MMRRYLFVFVLAAAACDRPDPVSLPSNVRSAAEAIDSAQLTADVTYLASDALLGRDTPSPGLDSAATYVERRLLALKLKPVGDSGTFRQHYIVRHVERDTANTWIEFGGRRLREGVDFLVIGFGDSVTLSAPLTYVGHGIRARKKNIDPYAGVTSKGRILVAHGPGVYPKGETFQTLGVITSDWDIPPMVARKEGAAAILLINPPRMLALWSRDMTRSWGRDSRELTPSPPGAFASLGVPMLWIRPDVARALLASAPQRPASILAGAERGDFAASFDLPHVARATIHIGASRTQTLRPHNLIAIVEGRDRTLRSEYVMLAAHLDGAVERFGGENDTIYNAADDNASGSAALLSVAEAMMRGPRPRRSVVFMWDTGEEVGLWGSRFFAANPPVPLDRIITYFNVDMIGRSKKAGTNVEGEEDLGGENEIFVVGPRVLSTSLDSLLERTSREYLGLGLNHKFDVASHEYFYPRTDAAPLLERGVLVAQLMNGEHPDYHGPGDEAAKLDLARMHKITKTLYAATWMLAERRERPAIDKGMPASVPQTPKQPQ